MSSSEASSSPERMPMPSGLPMGGLHVKMDHSSCSVTQAPGHPVDMQAASPLLMAVMGLLAKKDREK